VLVELDRIAPEDLAELIPDGWAFQAPKRVVAEWLARRGEA
jgi:hypothetical protein